MTAARQRSGIASMIRKIWSPSTLSAAGTAMNGPRCWVPAQMATSVVARNDKLAPGGPNRTAAQSRNGKRSARGVRDQAAMGPWRAKTRKATVRREAAREGRRQRQDGRNHGELGQDVRQQAGPRDDPVGLSASRGDERRIGEGGQEGREKDGSENEHHRAAQGIERRGIAEAAHEDGGDHGFAAVGDEETQYERRRPAGR